MKIGNWESAESMPMLYRELRELGLETNIAELEAFGFTVVPPEKVAPPEFLEAAKKALLRIVSDRFGSIEQSGNLWNESNENIRFILWDDPIFEKVVLLPAILGLAEYLIGTNCTLSLFDGWMAGPGKLHTQVHCDWTDPTRRTFPPESNHVNTNYLLTDYSIENGCLGFVPGSHRWQRGPSPEEGKAWADKLHPVEAPAGSALIFGDHVWHGSFPRKAPGHRMMILSEYSRPRLQMQEPFRESVTQEILDRNPIRFSGLMDIYGMFPFGKNDRPLERSELGPPGTGGASSADRYCSLFDNEPAAGRTSLRPHIEYYKHDGLMRRERNRKFEEAKKDWKFR